MDSYKPLEEFDDRPRARLRMSGSNKQDVQSASDIPAFLGDFKALKDMSRFDRQYRKLGDDFVPEKKRIDYVLVHPHVTSKMKEEMDTDDLMKEKKKEKLRDIFEEALKKQGFFVQTEVIGKNCYKKLHCPFRRLCQEAEKVTLEMPLAGCKAEKDESTNCCTGFLQRNFETDHVVDYISAPFLMDRIHLYKGYKDPTNFFRPAIRSLLVDHILINLDIREQAEPVLKEGNDEEAGCCGCFNSSAPGADEDVKDKTLQKIAFPYLKIKDVYTDCLILHEHSERSAKREDFKKEDLTETAREKRQLIDPRRDMDDTWTKFTKFQPLWKIRDYFGEKIAFYFAWSGTLITTLWIPMLFGLAIFIYGLVKSTQGGQSSSNNSTTTNNSTLTEELTAAVTSLLEVIKEAFDNEVTPFFALVICVWGTVFLEIWKQKTARLAYEWDVEEFEETEPDRPQFYGIKYREDPVTHAPDWFYPLKRQVVKFLFSGASLMFMVCLVLGSVVGVIVYRVIATIDYCPNTSSGGCLLLTTVLSSVLNAASVLILGKVYDYVAKKLTNWENHRTQTMYDDALIIKLFAFQFANNYASCFYIAFFRGRFDTTGVFSLGTNYTDKCEGTCMSQLSFQVLILMLAKPLPKFFSDIMLPFFKRKWRSRPDCMRCRCGKNQVDELEEKAAKDPKNLTFLEKEVLKENLGDFTMSEYTEKIIQYGFLMLFAASFPLAPLLSLLTNLIDIRVDAKRMLWWYRRPIAVIAEDIGTWYIILQFVNFVGVVSNAFLIAFTSSWGSQYDTITKLWIAIGFEHIVFLLKFLLAYIIPDVPSDVALAMRRKTHQLTTLLDQDRRDQEKEFTELLTKSRRTVEPLVYTEKADSDEWQPASVDHEGEFPHARQRHRVHRDDKSYHQDVKDEEEAPVRRLKKKKKKRKPHPPVEEEENEEMGHYEEINYEPDTFRESTQRQPSLKIRGPRGEELTEVAISDRSAMRRLPRLTKLRPDTEA